MYPSLYLLPIMPFCMAAMLIPMITGIKKVPKLRGFQWHDVHIVL